MPGFLHPFFTLLRPWLRVRLPRAELYADDGCMCRILEHLLSHTRIWKFRPPVLLWSLVLLRSFKPGFHIIAPVATVVAIVEKRVLTQKYFLSNASDTVFPYDRRCRSISLKLDRKIFSLISDIIGIVTYLCLFKYVIGFCSVR